MAVSYLQMAIHMHVRRAAWPAMWSSLSLSLTRSLSLYFTQKIPGKVSSLDALCYAAVQSNFRGDSTRDEKKKKATTGSLNHTSLSSLLQL